MPSHRAVCLKRACCGLFVAAAIGLPSGPALQAAEGDAPKTQHADALRLLDVWLEAQVAFDRVPALSAGVVIGQDLVWSKGYGAIDERRRVPAAADTVYSVCSISKLFTSIAVMQLVDDGKIALDDDIGKHLSRFAAMPRSDPDSGPITVRSLLTHSSGLPREADAAYWSPPDFPFPSREELLRSLANQRTFMRTSDHYQYSNLGMAVLGEMVTAVSGMPYAEHVQNRILAPLKLSDTHPLMPMHLYGQRLAVGYSALKRDGSRDLIKPFDTKGLAPAAGFVSTVNDLARFAAWQFRLNKAGGNEILRVASLRDMQRPQWIDPDGKTMWGLGFGVSREGANTVVGHTGHCPGYRTALSLALKDEVAVIALANANNAGPYTKQMRQLMLKGLRLPIAEPDPGQPGLASYAGRYRAQPWSSEEVIVPWGNDLVSLSLPSTDPAGDITVLQRVDKDTFRELRDDDSLGAEVAFQRGANGDVSGYTMWNHFYPRLGR